MSTAAKLCPYCGSANVRRSRERGMIDGIMRIFSRKPYRCLACRNRFYRRARRTPADGTSEGLAK